MILTAEEIEERLKSKKPLIEHYISLKHQLQPHGFDLTVNSIYTFKEAGKIDFSNEERFFPDSAKVVFKDKWAHLSPGIYKVKTNEYLNLPDNIMAFAQTRSSLLRMGAFAINGFWDAGFHGKSEFSLVVMNPHGLVIKQNARLVQLMFLRLEKPVSRVYSGIHKGLI